MRVRLHIRLTLQMEVPRIKTTLSRRPIPAIYDVVPLSEGLLRAQITAPGST